MSSDSPALDDTQKAQIASWCAIVKKYDDTDYAREQRSEGLDAMVAKDPSKCLTSLTETARALKGLADVASKPLISRGGAVLERFVRSPQNILDQQAGDFSYFEAANDMIGYCFKLRQSVIQPLETYKAMVGLGPDDAEGLQSACRVSVHSTERTPTLDGRAAVSTVDCEFALELDNLTIQQNGDTVTIATPPSASIVTIRLPGEYSIKDGHITYTDIGGSTITVTK